MDSQRRFDLISPYSVSGLAVASRKRPTSDTTHIVGSKRVYLSPVSGYLCQTVPVKTLAQNYLDDIFSKLLLDKADKQASKRLVDMTLTKITKYATFQIGGGMYRQQWVNAGSYPVKTKIGKADEFDVNIPLNTKWRVVRSGGKVRYGFGDLNTSNMQNLHNGQYLCYVPEGNQIPCGYAVVEVGIDRINYGGDIFYTRPSTSTNVPKKFLHENLETHASYILSRLTGRRLIIPPALAGSGSYLTSNRSATHPDSIELIPLDVKKDLFDRMTSSLYYPLNKSVYISQVSHGPALQMTIVPDRWSAIKHHISVDVTVSLDCENPLAEFGWPREKTKKAFSSEHINEVRQVGTHLVPKKDLFWAISFSKAEKALLRCLDRDQGCRKYVIKILKKFVQICSSQSKNGLPGISSHIIKTQVLWSCENHSNDPNYWRWNNRDVCLLNTLGELESTLISRTQLDYFNSELNILDGKEFSVLNELAEFMYTRRINISLMK